MSQKNVENYLKALVTEATKKIMAAERDRLIFGTGYIKCDNEIEAEVVETVLKELYE